MQPGGPETAIVWAKTLADGSVAVGLINRGEAPAPVTVTWKSLGFAGKKMQARDLWEHKSIETSADGYTATVPTHGAAMLRVSAK